MEGLSKQRHQQTKETDVYRYHEEKISKNVGSSDVLNVVIEKSEQGKTVEGRLKADGCRLDAGVIIIIERQGFGRGMFFFFFFLFSSYVCFVFAPRAVWDFHSRREIL